MLYKNKRKSDQSIKNHFNQNSDWQEEEARLLVNKIEAQEAPEEYRNDKNREQHKIINEKRTDKYSKYYRKVDKQKGDSHREIQKEISEIFRNSGKSLKSSFVSHCFEFLLINDMNQLINGIKQLLINY